VDVKPPRQANYLFCDSWRSYSGTTSAVKITWKCNVFRDSEIGNQVETLEDIADAGAAKCISSRGREACQVFAEYGDASLLGEENSGYE
jgi:hypothetical protein